MESDTSRLSRMVSRGAAAAAACCPPAGAQAITTAAVIQAPTRLPRTKCFVLTSRLPRWVYVPAGGAPLRAHLDHRHVVLTQNLRDLAAPAVDHRIERGLERLVAVPHRHCHAERERHAGNGVAVGQRDQGERNGLLLRPIARQG